MRRNYIGLTSSPHDTAMAIVNPEGTIVFAEATERYHQNKRAWNCPPDDIIRMEKIIKKYCEKEADLVISHSWTRRFINKIPEMQAGLASAQTRLSPSGYWAFSNIISGLANNAAQAGNNIQFQYQQINPNNKIIERSYDHHLTHAAASCYSSPFNEGLCVIIDGYGENSTSAVFHYENGNLTRISDIGPSIGSLGIYYELLCTLCGFDPIKGEQWKVMGLAPYGKYDEKIDQFLRSFIKVQRCRIENGSNSLFGIPKKEFESKIDEMRKCYKGSPHKAADLAFTGQKIFNDIMEELLNNLYQQHNVSDNLILGGGCALNSACNGLILERTPFKKLHVFSAPADDGNALGAALLAYYEDNPPTRAPAELMSPYLGESMSSKTLENLKQFGNLRSTLSPGKKIEEKAAELLSEGKIIGWVQGRAEFGPRALGNRSILADPRSPDIKDRLNAMVKFREEFRPFAPSILHEYGDEYFENYQETPYMERALRFRKEAANKVPGVVHVDGTGRLQSVKRELNEKYYDLIAAFNKLTGVPVVLNTSFNVMSKPIIHTVEDAVATFFTSGLDVLVIEDQMFEK